jgi:sucrose phosphorylase
LQSVYGSQAATANRLVDDVLAKYAARPASPQWDEGSAWLIAYADQFRSPDESPLVTLRRVIADHLEPGITGVHVLPWHPSSSDGGFSVMSFDEIDPAFGTWEDVEALAESTTVMADAVVNHASARGDLFAGFLADDPEYLDFFRTVDPEADLSAVVRPRSTPLATTFEKTDGTTVSAWTTFSADQVDLDYRNPAVLARMVDVLLAYVARGVRAVRLDAVCFLWKDEATTSIHLPQTHNLVQFLRACIDEVDTGVAVVTETNVPHHENIGYFGEPGEREAQAVYQFPLPPLVLHSFVSGSAGALRTWAAGLEFDRDDTTFLNFLASHDGIGLRPVEGLLDGAQLDALVEVCEAAGGWVNTRRLSDGTDVPYELTGTWFSHLAVGHPDAALDRHIAAYAIALALRGVPLLYAHSLFASTNDHDTFARTRHGRDLNRASFDLLALEAQLADRHSSQARCWSRLQEMLNTRAMTPAFRPDSAQEVLDGPDAVFGLRRTASTGEEAVVYVNVSGEETRVDVPPGSWKQLPDGRVVSPRLRLPAWSSVWLIAAP